MDPKVARALRAARRGFADGGDVVRERATILPLGTYEDGTTRAAWPGIIYEPAAAAKRLVDYFTGGNYRPGDEDATRQLAEDSFTVAGAMPVAGLAAAAVRPGVSLGSGGGKLTKSLPMDEASRLARAKEMGFDTDRVWYHGTATDEPIQQFRSGTKGDSPHVEHETPSIFFGSDPKLAGQYAESTGVERRHRVAGELIAEGKERQAQGLYGEDSGIANQMAKRLINEAKSLLPSDLARILGPAIDNGSHLDRAAMIEAIGPDSAKRFYDLLDMARHVGMDVPDKAAIYPTYLPTGMREVDANAFGGHFNEIIYDQLLRDAKAAGAPGLVVHNVVDSPWGSADPSSVAAVFDPKRIRSKYAAFDPDQIDSANILAANSSRASAPGLAAVEGKRVGDGSPVKLWHGTNRRFDRFDPEFMGSAGQGSFLGRNGFYFGRGPDDVGGYGRYIKEVDADLKNPLVIPTSNIDLQLSDADIADILKRGHDSVIMRLLDKDTETNKLAASLDQEIFVMDPRKLDIRRVYDQESADDRALLEALSRVGPYVWNDGPGRP